jgi:acetyl esterase/lipase
MKRLVKLTVIINSLFSFFNMQAQNYCSVFGAFLSPSYPSSTSTTIVNIDTVNTYYGQTFYTKLKIARPLGDLLPFAKRPMIIGLHGGGFISDSISMSATNGFNNMFANMYSAAQFGYIGASFDYRTGYGIVNENKVLASLMSPGFPACNAITPLIMQEFDNASYRATYDCLKAIDFIFQHSAMFPYVDTTQIYLYGSSAGAIVVLNAVLSETDEFTSLPIAEQLPFPKRHKIASVISLSGAVNSVTAAKLQSSSLERFSTPLFLAHGKADTLLSNTVGPLGNCTNIPSNYFKFGSSALSNIACRINLPHELFLIDKTGHDLATTSPVANTIISASFTYLYNSGICPSYPASIEKTYDLNGNIIAQNFCLPINLENKTDNKIKFIVFPNPIGVATFE